MDTTTRQVMAVAALALSSYPLLVVPPATANTSGPKASIEYAERQAAQDRPSKAQIEQREREQLGTSATTHRVPGLSGPGSGSDGGPTTWQIALGAALGAGLVGGVVVRVRQTNHDHPVASAP